MPGRLGGNLQTAFPECWFPNEENEGGQESLRQDWLSLLGAWSLCLSEIWFFQLHELTYPTPFYSKTEKDAWFIAHAGHALVFILVHRQKKITPEKVACYFLWYFLTFPCRNFDATYFHYIINGNLLARTW